MTNVRPEARVGVIVPCFNEATSLEACARALMGCPFVDEVVLVDDGSTDGTAAICTSLGRELGSRLSVIHLPENVGKNAAVREGAATARADLSVILDADMTVDVAALGEVSRLLAATPRAFVFGSRLRGEMEPGAMSWARRCGNRVFSFWVSRLVGRPVPDVLCGLKAMPRDVLLAVPRSNCRWGDFDLVFAAADQGLVFIELPVRYRRRVTGRSKMRVWSASAMFAWQCIRYWRSRRRTSSSPRVRGRISG